MNSVEHVPAEKRFVVRFDAAEAELTYVEREGPILDLVHTFVPPEARGQGVAEDLVDSAFAYARGNDYRVRASCPYVRRWLEDHPEQADIVDTPA